MIRLRHDRGLPRQSVAESVSGWARGWGWLAAGWLLAALAVDAAPLQVRWDRPTLDRWVYPFNFQAGVRPVAPTYGSFDPRFDTRDAQFLLGWDTAAQVAPNAGPARYLIRRARITLTSVAPVLPNRPFVYDPTQDPYWSYLTNGEPGYVPDPDAGRPIELYGAAFRGGFTAETFLEGSPFGPLGPISGGNISIGTRNAYAAMFDDRGALIDIANHIAQRNASWTNAPFEVQPFSVGRSTDANPGEEMPDGGRMTFDVDLAQPLVNGYLQQALDAGRLRLVVSCLSPAGQSTPGGTGAGGAGAYPWWATKENLLYDPPRFELEVVVVSDTDTDRDGLPDDWEEFWLENLDSNADDDPDLDGASNRSELGAGTNPAQAASVLKLSDWGFSPDLRLSVSFPIAPSRTYAVEASLDGVVWAVQPGQVTYPVPGQARWVADAEITAVPPPPYRFYRLRVAP